MRYQSTALYLPYGAYELKARYQRNLLTATGIVIVTVAMLVVLSYLFGLHEAGAVPPRPPKGATGGSLGPGHGIIVQHQGPVARGGRRSRMTRPGIPVPVPDSCINDQIDVTIPTNDERSGSYSGPDVDSGWDGGEGRPGGFFYENTDYYPPPDSFIIHEVEPDWIYEEVPEYPRLARQLRMEGRVWIKALVDKDGSVVKALVAKSSDNTMLDEAALRAALKNRFSPAIQNGRPVAIWVTYSVQFTMSGGVR